MASNQKFALKAWGYHIRFDGDLLLGNPIKGIVARAKIEIPVNIILDYKYKSVLSIGRLDMYVNSYTHGQVNPDIRQIQPFYFVHRQSEMLNKLLQTLDSVIIANLEGTNFGLSHICQDRLRAFYEDQKHKTWRQGMASMKIMYASQKENTEGGNVLSLPTQHHMAS